MSQEIIKIPPAKSMITGLRCIGYNFSTALADIIDNSISANAKNICVISNPDASVPYVAIFDDGCGMGRKELENAMTLGSDRSDKEESEIELGRFGLGLKSASFSQCLRLTVVSKNISKVNAMRYDLEKIQSTNSWTLDVLDDDEILHLPEVNKIFESKSGTLVIWENFDKLEEEAKSFKESFISTIALAKKHVELVFHRFYDEINFEFNGHKIEKRDPFLSEYQCSQKGRTQTISVGNSTIVVTPFVLPYANSLKEEHKKMLGNPKSIYDDQGFYIYRNKRLIIWGSWLHMNIRSEFNKLARVRVDIPSELDSLWMLDVKKSSAKVPDLIKEQLRISINDSIVRSKREVKYLGKKEAEAEMPLWKRITYHGGEVKYLINREDNPIYNELCNILDSEEKRLLDAYLDKVEQFIPKGLIVSDNADSLKILNSEEELEEEKLIEELLEFAKHSIDPEKSISYFLQCQGYKKIEYRKSEILRRLKNG